MGRAAADGIRRKRCGDRPPAASDARTRRLSVAVDTNVIAYLVQGTGDTVRRASLALERASASSTSLIICAPVYAELLASPGWTKADLDNFVADTKLRVDWNLGADVWADAGLAFATYARRRIRHTGAPRRLLADFVIGAYACFAGSLLTADGSFYRTNFPKLRLLDV